MAPQGGSAQPTGMTVSTSGGKEPKLQAPKKDKQWWKPSNKKGPQLSKPSKEMTWVVKHG